ncbi:MAG: S1C family serine protease [Planctomycetota bacterium]|jgi:S1-C subfamily serine protease
MFGIIALSVLLVPQEHPAQPEGESDVQIIEVPAPILDPADPRLKLQGIHLQALRSSSALAQVEEELIQLYGNLGPSLVEVSFLFSEDTEREKLIVASGVVLDNFGRIVTPILLDEEQRDVLLDKITISRVDGHEFEASLIDWDEEYGLSLLHATELRGLAPDFWNGSWMQEGSLVISMGNGFGLRSSMHLGLLTGRGRNIDEAIGLLQVTNPVNLADSGGLLANRRGQVIGILLTSYADLVNRRQESIDQEEIQPRGLEAARRAEGVSFAIPVESIFRSFAEHFPSSGAPRLMGVMVNAEIRVIEEAGKQPSHGWQLRLTGVEPGSPADLAGVRENDLIISLHGWPTPTLQELGRAIHQAPLATRVVVSRAGELLEFPLEFER